MKLSAEVLLCGLFSAALCGGNTQPESAKVYMFTGAEGAIASLKCSPSLTGNRKFFCRNTCAAEDVLINTDAVSAQSGRYSVSYKPESSTRGSLTVTITGLTRADSGRYRCGLGSALAPESYSDFEVRVSDEPFLDRNSGLVRTDFQGEDITYLCSGLVYSRQKFFCKGECRNEEDVLVETDENKAWRGRFALEYAEGVGFTVTIRQATTSDTGSYRCGFGRALAPSSQLTFPIIVIEAVPSGPQLLLPLGVCVLVALVLLAVFLVFLLKWKTSRNLGGNTRRAADDVHMQASVTYENCPSGSPPEDSCYQSLDPASRDQDQEYCTF